MENFKEALNIIKKSIKSFGEHAKEFFKAFSEPAKQDQSLKALAIAAGIGESELNELTKSAGGVKWEFADDEHEKTKKGRKQSNITPTQIQVKPVQRTIEGEKNNKGIDR